MASEALVLDGVSAPTMRVKEDGDGASGPRSVWIDTAGREVRMETATPVGTMVVVARKQNGAAGAGELVSGAFEHSLIRSNVRLPRARTMPRLVVRLTPEDASQNVPDLNGPGERVLERQDGSALVEVRRGNVVDPSSSDGAEQALAPFLGSSVQIDPDDPGVRAIAHAATAGLTDEWDKALSLTRWVSQNMTFDAGILFASSSELAAGRHGTCAGYAVLLAALLRAEAIPARLAMGVVYVEGAFGGHAWVEARVHGSWLALDAALPSDGPADATHIAFARDSLEAGLGRLMMPLGRLLGHTKLAVLEYTGPDGRTVRVDERTHPWTVSGSTYVNPGLGLSLRAPAGYRFTKLDAMYPDATLVELEAPAGTVSLVEAEARTPGSDLARAAAALSLAGEGACERRVVAGRPACVSRAEGAERAAFSDGPALFVVTARASGATSLLDATVSGLRFDHAP
jgi:hypothetical protein